MKTLIATLAFIFSASAAGAQEAEFKIALDKTVANLLTAETKIGLWHSSNRKGWRTLQISDFPLKLARTDLAHHGRNLTFSDSKVTLFGIFLSRSFIEKNDKCTIAFTEPVVKMRYIPLTKEIRAQFEIQPGMDYTDLPIIDRSTRTLRQTKPPMIELVTKSEGKIFLSTNMVEGCMGLKWCWFLQNTDDSFIQDARSRVSLDSGGLFKTIETVYDLVQTNPQ